MQMRPRGAAGPRRTPRYDGLPLHRLPAHDLQRVSLSSLYRKSDFEVTAGEPVAGGLHGTAQHIFCPHCMSWLFTRPKGMDAFVQRARHDAGQRPRVCPVHRNLPGRDAAVAGDPGVHRFETFPPAEAFPSLLAQFAQQSSQLAGAGAQNQVPSSLQHKRARQNSAKSLSTLTRTTGYRRAKMSAGSREWFSACPRASAAWLRAHALRPRAGELPRRSQSNVSPLSESEPRATAAALAACTAMRVASSTPPSPPLQGQLRRRIRRLYCARSNFLRLWANTARPGAGVLEHYTEQTIRIFAISSSFC